MKIIQTQCLDVLGYDAGHCDFILKDGTKVSGTTWLSVIKAAQTAFIDLRIRRRDDFFSKKSKESQRKSKSNPMLDSRPNIKESKYGTGSRPGPGNKSMSQDPTYLHSEDEDRPDGVVINEIIKSIKVPDHVYFELPRAKPGNGKLPTILGDWNVPDEADVEPILEDLEIRGRSQSIDQMPQEITALHQPPPLVMLYVLPIFMWPTGPPPLELQGVGDSKEDDHEKHSRQNATEEVRLFSFEYDCR
jgi:hypothetical protein